MRKSLFSMMLGAFLTAGSAQAFIGRAQSFDIGALNRVEWAGGIGSARGETQTRFAQRQEFSDRYLGLSSVQRQRGTLIQTATVSGTTGLGTAGQDARIRGTQDLPATSDRNGTGGAQQRLGVSLESRLVKPNGIGQVIGRQQYTGGQTQTIGTPYGTNTQSQRVDIVQSSAIVTQIDIDPTVTNNVNVELSQSQAPGR